MRSRDAGPDLFYAFGDWNAGLVPLFAGWPSDRRR